MKLYLALKLFDLDNKSFYNKDKDCKIILIKKKYKKLMLLYHPDKNTTSGNANANANAQIINEAYSLLLKELFLKEDYILEFLKTFTKTGDIVIDNDIKKYGYKLYEFFKK